EGITRTAKALPRGHKSYPRRARPDVSVRAEASASPPAAGLPRRLRRRRLDRAGGFFRFASGNSGRDREESPADEPIKVRQGAWANPGKNSLADGPRTGPRFGHAGR